MLTLFRLDFNDVLWNMTFAQCVTLLDVRNERERQANQASERRSSGKIDHSKYRTDDPKNLPTLGQLNGIMAGLNKSAQK
jgi:hypothetical protein